VQPSRKIYLFNPEITRSAIHSFRRLTSPRFVRILFARKRTMIRPVDQTALTTLFERMQRVQTLAFFTCPEGFTILTV
jgi:hypothetical protein